METIDSIIQYVRSWRKNNAHTTRGDGSLSEESLAKFMEGLNERANKLSYNPGNGKTVGVLFGGKFFSYTNDGTAKTYWGS